MMMAGMLNTDDHYSLRFMRKLNVDDDRYLDEPQLYSAILNKDVVALKTGNQKMGLTSTKYFSSDPMLEGIRFTGVKTVVYPVLPQTVYDAVHSKVTKPLIGATLLPVDTRGGNLQEIVYDGVLNFGTESLVAINSVLVDDYYVLSQKFYENKSGKTVIELMLSNYFENKPNNAVDLLGLVNGYINWGGLERFYYIPILLALIKNSIRSL
jgi:hypothetical protein